MAALEILSVISKLRPRIVRRDTVELDELADEIALQSGFDRGDSRDFAYKFAYGLMAHLKKGDYVKLGDIGSFSVTCSKDKEINVSYRASSDAKKQLQLDFQGEFQNNQYAGLDEEGFAAAWLELHPEDSVIMRDGSTRPV
jgi:nucleoid DNA-binding protein